MGREAGRMGHSGSVPLLGPENSWEERRGAWWGGGCMRLDLQQWQLSLLPHTWEAVVPWGGAEKVHGVGLGGAHGTGGRAAATQAGGWQWLSTCASSPFLLFLRASGSMGWSQRGGVGPIGLHWEQLGLGVGPRGQTGGGRGGVAC